MYMHMALTLLSFVLLGITIATFLAWMLSFSLLMRIVRRRHPRYFNKLARPYTPFGDMDAPRRKQKPSTRRRAAWWQGLAKVYAGVPRDFLRDATCRRLARTSRLAMRCFVPCALLFALLILPVDGFVFVLNHQTDATIIDDGASRTISTSPAGSTLSSAGTNDDTPPAKPSSPPITRTVTTSDPTSYTSAASPTFAQTPALPVKGETSLARADLTATFATIAPVGQKRAQKMDVCTQLVDNFPVENDLGPGLSSDDICANSNLLTYGTY